MTLETLSLLLEIRSHIFYRSWKSCSENDFSRRFLVWENLYDFLFSRNFFIKKWKSRLARNISYCSSNLWQVSLLREFFLGLANENYFLNCIHVKKFWDWLTETFGKKMKIFFCKFFKREMSLLKICNCWRVGFLSLKTIFFFLELVKTMNFYFEHFSLKI